MKRYVISPIVGSGTENDPYRASVADVAGVSSAFVIPTDPNTGKPLYGFAFGIVATTDINSVAAIVNVFVFPDLSLDALMSSMDPATQTAMNQSVGAYILDPKAIPPKQFGTAFYTGANSYRDVLNGIVQQTSPAANIVNLDAAGG